MSDSRRTGNGGPQTFWTGRGGALVGWTVLALLLGVALASSCVLGVPTSTAHPSSPHAAATASAFSRPEASPRSTPAAAPPTDEIARAVSLALHPDQTNISTSNLTGFIVGTFDLTLLTNEGAEFAMAVPPVPPALTGGTTSFVVCVAGEDLNSTVSAVVGFVETTLDGLTEGIPIYLVNDSGVSIIGSGSTILSPSSVVHTFVMQETHGDWWEFTLDGALIHGGIEGNGNGTADLGLSSTALSASVPIFTYIIPQNLSDVPLSSVKTALELRNGASTWTAPTEGLNLIDLNTGVAGYEQDPLIPPDSLEFGGALAVQASAAVLWDTGPLPALTLQAHGLAPSLPSLGVSDFRVWTNSSSGGMGTATLTNLTSGGSLATLATGPSPGEEELEFVAPAVRASTSVSITLTATAANYVGAQVVLQVSVGPGVLNVAASRTALRAYSEAAIPLPVWINSSYKGTSTPTDPENVTASVVGGGSVTAEGAAGPGVGSYAFVFTAPAWELPSSATITVNASSPGFVPATLQVQVSVWPRPLSLVAPAPATLPPGGVSTVPVTVVSPSGSLPSGSSSWWNVSITSPSGPADVTGSAAILGSTVNVALSIPSGFVGTLDVQLSASGAGYNATSVSWQDTVVGALEVSLSSLPDPITSGTTVSVSVSVSTASGVPLPDALVDWSTSLGTFQGPGTASATSYTNAAGVSTVVYVAPNAGQSEGMRLSVAVSAAYYAPSDAQASSTVSPVSGSSLDAAWSSVGAPALLTAFLLVAVVLAVLIVLELRRPQAAARRPMARPKGGKPARPSSLVAGAVSPVPGAAGVAPEPSAEDEPMDEVRAQSRPVAGSLPAVVLPDEPSEPSVAREAPEVEPPGQVQARAHPPESPEPVPRENVGAPEPEPDSAGEGPSPQAPGPEASTAEAPPAPKATTIPEAPREAAPLTSEGKGSDPDPSEASNSRDEDPSAPAGPVAPRANRARKKSKKE